MIAVWDHAPDVFKFYSSSNHLLAELKMSGLVQPSYTPSGFRHDSKNPYTLWKGPLTLSLSSPVTFS
jgi:hypothetical protein